MDELLQCLQFLLFAAESSISEITADTVSGCLLLLVCSIVYNLLLRYCNAEGHGSRVLSYSRIKLKFTCNFPVD